MNSQFSVSIHILTLLATKPDEFFPSSLVASSVNTNPALIRKLLAKLQSAGFVESLHGSAGGSRLRRAAKDILLSEVFAAVNESAIYVVHSDCNPRCEVGRTIERSLRSTFSEWESRLSKEMSKRTIADVLESVRTPNG